MCLLHRFDGQADGSLLPAPRLGSYAFHVAGGTAGQPITLDPYGQPFWLADASGPLAQSPRLIVDRHWVWSFSPDGSTVQRSDVESLQLDLELDVQMQVRDIASDGQEGIWILCGDEILYILHYDCQGCLHQRYRAPYEAAGAMKMVSVNRGLHLALLSKNGTTLSLVDGTSGGTLRTIDVGQLASGWSIKQFTSDAGDRIGLWGTQPSYLGPSGVLFVLDANGDLIDGPLNGLFNQPNGAQPPKEPELIHIAIFRENIWFSTDSGLWRLDTTDASGARESDSSLITPALYSPATSTDRGWLRAEVFTDMEKGSALEVQIATTDQQSVVDEVNRIASDPLLSWAQKQNKIWELLDTGNNKPYSFPGPAVADVPIAIPLLEPRNQWAWLRISVITPPGTTPLPLKELRVLYPNLSIAEQLPAIFRGEKNDPTGTLRKVVGVLESTTQQFDERIRGVASYLDARTTSNEWLDYLARWFDLPWDDGLPVDSKRRILQRAGELLERRGTRRGLLILLQSLLGEDASVEIVDVTVDHAPIRLGGCGARGGILPAILAGASLRTPTLGEKAVLGRARLCGDGNALTTIVPKLQIRITAPQKSRRDLEEFLRRVLLQFVPAGVTIAIQWRTAETISSDVIGEYGIVLNAPHPGTLGLDSAIGYSRLGGRDRGKIAEIGFEMGRLQ
jgi:phage tail-like protein